LDAKIEKEGVHSTVANELVSGNSWQLSLTTVNQIFVDYDKKKKKKTDDQH
jgi:hypothetical protein